MGARNAKRSSENLRVVALLLGAASSLGGCLPHDADLGRDPTPVASENAEKDPPASGPQAAAEKRAKALLTKAQSDPPLTEPFSEEFNAAALGSNWRLTGPGWRVREGHLCGTKARNHPAWLARKLPVNARIEFDARSDSPDGDIKVEVWGDGARFAAGTTYDDATSYVVIFGGWKNRFHVLARLDEHGDDRKEVALGEAGEALRTRRVQTGKTYRFAIERRDGATISWSVDGETIHTFEDKAPLSGDGHDHFAFNDWDVPVCFDNLLITPL